MSLFGLGLTGAPGASLSSGWPQTGSSPLADADSAASGSAACGSLQGSTLARSAPGGQLEGLATYTGSFDDAITLGGAAPDSIQLSVDGSMSYEPVPEAGAGVLAVSGLALTRGGSDGEEAS